MLKVATFSTNPKEIDTFASILGGVTGLVTVFYSLG